MSFDVIRGELDKLEREMREDAVELEAYQMAGMEDTALRDEVGMLREFIEDVRRGIRTLDEYDTICGPVYR